MKNIYLIPTNQPSRLFKDDFGRLIYSINIDQEQNHFEPQNIYITSDEEIKEGDWMYYKHFGEDIVTKYNTWGGLNTNVNEHKDYYKKIILTTDQDLIKNGVQAIDNEFLEWFVKNPSCEKVEVEREMYMPQSNGKISDGKITHEISLDPSQNTLPYYKIIIPKEPKLINNCPKCGLDLIIREHCTPICADIDCRGIILSNETLREWASKEEPKQEYEYIGECNGNNGNGCFMDSCGHDCGCFVRIPKQETTLEESAKKIITNMGWVWENTESSARMVAEYCAKWQQEIMYSEKDMIDFYLFCIKELLSTKSPAKLPEEYLEQFKKK